MISISNSFIYTATQYDFNKYLKILTYFLDLTPTLPLHPNPKLISTKHK